MFLTNIIVIMLSFLDIFIIYATFNKSVEYVDSYINYIKILKLCWFFFFFQAEDGIRDADVTGVQTCALPILSITLTNTIRAQDAQGRGGRQGGAQSGPSNTDKRPYDKHDFSGVWTHYPEDFGLRSEERRVGKECRSGWWPAQQKDKMRDYTHR